MLEIRTILVPTDFSRHSEAALKYACGLAERVGATLHLLHVLAEVMPVGPDPMLAPVLPPEYFRESESASREALERLLDPTWGTPAGVETSVRWGSPVDVIVDHAATQHADLIVIATHGRTGISHVLLGSVAERIIREAPCPVLTVRDRTHGSEPALRLAPKPSS
jgi:nucleotide-binding universal stress UspA family protein